MSDLIVDTSPIQYLHQVELLHILPSLAKTVFVPSAVLEEIKMGHSLGVNLPNFGSLECLN